jgi:hypothetical protein
MIVVSPIRLSDEEVDGTGGFELTCSMTEPKVWEKRRREEKNEKSKLETRTRRNDRIRREDQRSTFSQGLTPPAELAGFLGICLSAYTKNTRMFLFP